MIKKLAIMAVLSAFGSASAFAADLPMKAAPYAPMAVYNWTGGYIGINAGYGLGNTVIDDKDCLFSCSSQTLSPNGFTVGGTLGYNYQFGSTVLGIEGDWNWIDASRTHTDPDWASVHNAKIQSFGTIRGRAGLAVDRTLVYVTAGVAFVDQRVAVFDPDGDTGGFAVNKVSTGLAVGAGAEFAISGNWTAKLEYLYITVPSIAQIQDNSCTSTECTYNVKTDLHVARAGVNYRF
jgi:outer membrane immunogenic protein